MPSVRSGSSMTQTPSAAVGFTLTYPFLLTFAVGGAIGTGCYLRTLEARRARTVAAVRLAERLQLAWGLHDFVAHHVTGVVVQAQAADVIHQDEPHQVGHHRGAPPPPTGGPGGYGLTGLREKTQSVGGTLTAGPSDDGGRWLIAHFPALPTDTADPVDRARA